MKKPKMGGKRPGPPMAGPTKPAKVTQKPKIMHGGKKP